MKLTNLVEHLVTLVQDKGLDVAQVEVLIADQSIQTTGGGNDDVGVGVLVRQNLDILLDGSTTVEDRSLDVRQILGETGVLVLDLVGELTGVAHHENRALAGNGLQLVKSSQDEDRSLTQTGLGLAKNIDVEDGSWDADLLDCGAERWLDMYSTQDEAKVVWRRNVRPSPGTTRRTYQEAQSCLPGSWPFPTSKTAGKVKGMISQV